MSMRVQSFTINPGDTPSCEAGPRSTSRQLERTFTHSTTTRGPDTPATVLYSASKASGHVKHQGFALLRYRCCAHSLLTSATLTVDKRECVWTHDACAPEGL